MPNLNVVVLGLPGYAGGIAKKGSVSDLVFYDLKKGDSQITLVEPLRYPERLAPLFYACSTADAAIVVVENIDHLFGESLVMLDSLGISQGAIVLRGFLQREQIAPYLKGTVAEGYDFKPDDPVSLREWLLEEAASRTLDPQPSGTVPLDQHFNVKGVGTVVLGKVVDGTVRKHDKLTVHPLGEVVNVRSIQKHDDDSPSADRGDRVGLALRGIESERLDKGYVLSSDPTITDSNDFQAVIKLNGFWRTPVTEGMVLHLGHWMQVIPFRVASATKDGTVHLVADDGLIHLPGDDATVMYLEGGKLRVVGSIKLPA